MPPYEYTDSTDQASSNSNKNINEYRIRSMVQTDLPTVYAIDHATWKDQAWPIGQFFECLNYSPSNCWVLENTTNNSLLGYGLQYSTNSIAHIANFCIHPNQRGRGLGGILLRHMIDFNHHSGRSIIELEVDTSNTHAYKLYYKHSFRITQLLQQYYSETADAYRMRLVVNRTN